MSHPVGDNRPFNVIDAKEKHRQEVFPRFQQLANVMETNDVSANQIVQLHIQIKTFRKFFDFMKDDVSVASEFQSYYGVVTDYPTVIAEVTGKCDEISTLIAAAMPADVDGWLNIRKLDADGVSTRSFTPAQTAALRSKLLELIGVFS